MCRYEGAWTEKALEVEQVRTVKLIWCLSRDIKAEERRSELDVWAAEFMAKVFGLWSLVFIKQYREWLTKDKYD